MTDTPDFNIEWHDSGREPQCAPNPAYPNGIDIDATGGKPGCIAKLPYPARRCGVWLVTCKTCGYRIGLTTAGRRDDPRSVKLPCKERSAVPAIREKIKERETVH